MPPVDLVLAEGWKTSALPKIEVHRRQVSREFLCSTDPDVVAVVTDEPVPADLPSFDADDLDAIAFFVVGWFAAQSGRAEPRRSASTPRGAPISRRTPAPRAARRRPARASR
jgi:hypothetical protein